MSYAVALPGGESKLYERLNDATRRADKVSETNAVELEVVHTGTDAVVYVATPVRGRRFRPYERVETPKHQAPHYDGFVPAYQRKRITCTVYRGVGENKGTWRVHDGRTGKYADVVGTKSARELTNKMGKGELIS